MTEEGKEIVFESPFKTAIRNLQMADLPASLAFLERAGYRVIPKEQIVKVGAYANIPKDYEKYDPAAAVDLVTTMLGQQIVHQLLSILKTDRRDNNGVFEASMYSTMIEVIKP